MDWTILALVEIRSGPIRGDTMSISIRAATPSDVPALARICFDAFQDIAGRHGFPPDIPVIEAAIGIVSAMVRHDRVFGIAAEQEGRLVGSNFLDERNIISGIGPITIDPAV